MRIASPPPPSPLQYAQPRASAVMPARWLRTTTWIWAIGSMLEQAAVLWIIYTIAVSRGFRWDLREVIDLVLPPIAALGTVWALGRSHRDQSRVLSPAALACLAAAVGLALVSIAIWSWQVLPAVMRARSPGGDSILWVVELILGRLLPVAWPIVVLIFAWRGRPTRRGAGAALAFWALGALLCSGCATAALAQSRGLRAFSSDIWFYTVMPPWTLLLAALVVIGLILWIRPHWHSGGIVLLVAGIALLLAMGLLHAWNNVRMTELRHWQSLQLFLRPANLCNVLAEVFDSLLLWQIAPMALLLFATRGSRASDPTTLE